MPRQLTPAGDAPPVASPDALYRAADRRQVTVLFADVSGFTALAERLDPEEVRAFQNALFEMLAQAITRHGGFVAKFLGDAAWPSSGRRSRTRTIRSGRSTARWLCGPAARP